ncbi:MAG: hypothetical protein HQ522_09145, partial [Bacteroidetes bacterium]|nr:hypothetical protein [Bacteroidota bacterium]
MKNNLLILVLVAIVLLSNYTTVLAEKTEHSQYQDVPYLQDFSVKYYFNDAANALEKVFSDRNEVIRILSSNGLLIPGDGAFLYPGKVVADKSYRTLANKRIVNELVYKNQFVYLDDEAVFSNAWAGSLFSKHDMKNAKLFAGGEDFTFLVSDGKNLKCIHDSEQLWKGKISDNIIDIRHTEEDNLFWILGAKSLSTFSPSTKKLDLVFEGEDFTSFDIVAFDSKTIIGTSNGYIEINNISKKQMGEIKRNLPCTQITAVEEVNGNVWFGSTIGAFMLRADGKYNYYNGERWLADNHVKHISEGPANSVLILSEKGLGQICFKEMTLEEKAMYYEKQVRSRHIRNGFNAALSGLTHGDLATGYLSDSDNDGLWTSMYLGGEIFRYAVTKSDDALQNCIEALDAIERLYTINPVAGFPSRSFERSGYMNVLADSDRWQHAEDPEWDWKSTTSSDEAIGHIFAMGAFAELIDVEPYRTRAVKIIDQLMQHIVDNDFYMIDYDGKPTTWGKWNPEYVNARPKMIGDRKINSSNIIAMLQTAFHFTQKEIYKQKAEELMYEHGYLENLMFPMSKVTKAPEDSDDWSKMLSSEWNHS